MSAESFFLNATDNLASAISFGQPKPTSVGGKSVGIFAGKGMLKIKMPPKMRCWGAEKFVPQDGSAVADKYTMTLQFPRAEYKTPEFDAALRNLLELENRILDEATKADWFKPKKSREVINAMWTPFVKWPKKESGEPDMENPLKSPSLKVKLAQWEGEYKFKIFNQEKEIIFPKGSAIIEDIIPKGCEISCILQCSGLWFAGGRFGATWKLFQGVVIPKAQLSLDMCHIDFGEEVEVRAAPKVEKSVELTVADSDDEETPSTDPDSEYTAPQGAAEEPAEAAEPAPAAATKKGAKKR
jgi:hypothetical protein